MLEIPAPLLRPSGHTKYTIEAFTLLSQYYYLFPPQLAQQLKWSHFVNTTGQKGHSIAAGLHVEHLNRMCKDAVHQLGANKTPKAIVRVGKAISSGGRKKCGLETRLLLDYLLQFSGWNHISILPLWTTLCSMGGYRNTSYLHNPCMCVRVEHYGSVFWDRDYFRFNWLFILDDSHA